MSAERTPQTNQSWLSAPLVLLTRTLLRAPRTVLVLAIGLACAAVFIAAGDMGFRTNRLDLLSPSADYNKLWIDYLSEFGEGDDAVIVVRGPSRQAVSAALDEVADAVVEEDRFFHSVLHRVDLSSVRAKGLHYLSVEELQQLEQSLAEIGPVLSGDWSQVRVDHQLQAAAMASNSPQASAAQQAKARAQLERLSISLAAWFDEEGSQYKSPWPIPQASAASETPVPAQFAEGDGRMLAEDGRMGFVLLRLQPDEEQKLDPTGAAIRQLRDVIARTAANHPDVSIGLTGLPVMEYDEMQTSQRDMLRASLVSLLGVACLFMAGLGGVRHPLLTVAMLLLALAWSFGYVTLSVGHLNILSVSFGVILIGLGIDFGIHYVTRYLQLRGENLDCSEALQQTARSVGPGVAIGAITTAIAFFAAYLTKFTGIAELGTIAGGGILLCLLATLVVLPVMIYLVDYRSSNLLPPRPLEVSRCINPLLRLPSLTLFAAVVMTGVMGAGIAKVRYDHNLLNLQPRGLESVELERQLLEETDHSVWFAISIAPSAEELLDRKDRFEQLDSVERTEQIVSLLPADVSRKTPIIARIHRQLAHLPERPPMIPVASQKELTHVLAATGVSMPVTGPRDRETQRRLSAAGDRFTQMSQREVFQQASQFQHHIAADLLSQLHRLREVSQPDPPALEDLPPSLVDRFVGQNRSHLLKIYGRGEIWDMADLQTFVTEVKSVDPDATGQPLQTFYASRQMQSSYVNAALYALAAVTLVLLIDFRSMSLTLLALVPVAAGVVQMLGIMGLLGIPLNPANMIVLPLILGIGLDDGVHVVHDFRHCRGKYSVSPSTSTAIVITSLTSMVGFGSLMLASHQGLQSLGRVLTIGVTCCMVSSLVLLPALLRWMGSHDAEEANTQPPPSEEPEHTIPTEDIQPRRVA